MKIIRTLEVYASYRVNVATVKAVDKILSKLEADGKFELEAIEDEVLKEQTKCFAYLAPDFRVDCSAVRQWGQKPNDKRDTATISFTANKYDGDVEGLIEALGLKDKLGRRSR